MKFCREVSCLPGRGCLASKRREGAGEDVVLLGTHAETDNSSMLVSAMCVLAVTVAPKAAIRTWRCAGPKGMRPCPYKLMVATIAARASADWLETGASWT